MQELIRGEQRDQVGVLIEQWCRETFITICVMAAPKVHRGSLLILYTLKHMFPSCLQCLNSCVCKHVTSITRGVLLWTLGVHNEPQFVVLVAWAQVRQCLEECSHRSLLLGFYEGPKEETFCQ